MPNHLIFVRTWKGFAADFPFERFDDVDDESIPERLEAFCYEQLRPKDKSGKRIRGEVWARIRDRRRDKKAAAARRRSQMMPHSEEAEALHRLKKAGLLVLEEVRDAKQPQKRTPFRRVRLPDKELRNLMQLGLSYKDACRLRLSDYLSPEDRMFYAKWMAQQTKLEAQWEEDHRAGTYCRLDVLTGKQCKPLRHKDPKGPSLGCRIACATGWLTGPLARFGELSPSRRLFVAETDTPVQADGLTRLLGMWNGPEYEDLLLYRARFAVVPASEIPVVDQTSQRLYLESLLSRDPGCVVEAVQKRVATILPKMLETLRAAEPAPLPPTAPAAGEPGGTTTVGQEPKRKRPLRRGPKPHRDAKQDKRVWQLRQDGMPYKVIAREVYGDETKRREVARAIDSHRKKLERKSQK